MVLANDFGDSLATSLATSLAYEPVVPTWAGLTFTSIGTSTVYLDNIDNSPNCEYSNDGGSTWVTFPTTGPAMQFTGTIWVRGTNPNGFSTSENNYSRFTFNGSNIEASGSVMSLIDGVGETTVIPSEYCFIKLLQNCTFLLKAPYLTATTLTSNCYRYMFNGCTSLNEIHCDATDISATDCTYNWLSGVAGTGTFHRADTWAGWSIDSDSGIPSGWTVIPPAPSYTVTFTCSNGTVTAAVGETAIQSGDQVEVGKTVVFTITPDEGYEYTGENPESVLVTGAVTKSYVCTEHVVPQGLKLTSAGTSTIKFAQVGTYGGTWPIEVSTDGNTWTSYTLGTTINLSDGESVYFRGQKDSIAQSSSNYRRFEMTGSIAVSGDCTSLLNGVGGVTDLTPYGYGTLFGMFILCKKLTSASGMTLPSTTLVPYCYDNMFNTCSVLSSVPSLPATILKSSCYHQMFAHCVLLNEIHCAATDISANACTDSWLNDVAASGNFYTPASTAWATGGSGIPSGWTRHNEPTSDEEPVYVDMYEWESTGTASDIPSGWTAHLD